MSTSVIMWNNTYYNYYSGWDGNVWRTGLATSNNGVDWDKSSNNPILDIREDNWDSSYIAANGSAVLFQNKVYYFYHGLNSDTKASAIGLTVFDDGENISMRTNAPVLNTGGGIRGTAQVLRIHM